MSSADFCKCYDADFVTTVGTDEEGQTLSLPVTLDHQTRIPGHNDKTTASQLGACSLRVWCRKCNEYHPQVSNRSAPNAPAMQMLQHQAIPHSTTPLYAPSHDQPSTLVVPTFVGPSPICRSSMSRTPAAFFSHHTHYTAHAASQRSLALALSFDLSEFAVSGSERDSTQNPGAFSEAMDSDSLFTPPKHVFLVTMTK